MALDAAQFNEIAHELSQLRSLIACVLVVMLVLLALTSWLIVVVSCRGAKDHERLAGRSDDAGIFSGPAYFCGDGEP